MPRQCSSAPIPSLFTVASQQRNCAVPQGGASKGHPTLYGNWQEADTALWAPFSEQPKTTMCQTLGSPHPYRQTPPKTAQAVSLLYTQPNLGERERSFCLLGESTWENSSSQGCQRTACDNIEHSQLDAWMKHATSLVRISNPLRPQQRKSFLRNSEGSTATERASASPQHCTSSQHLGFLPLEVTSRHPK